MLFLAAIALAAWLIFQPSPNARDQARELHSLVANNFPVVQNVHLRFSDRGFVFPDLAQAIQNQLDYRLRSENISYIYRVVDELPTKIGRPVDVPEVGDMVLTDGATTDPTNSQNSEETGNPKGDISPEDLTKTSFKPEYAVELTYSDDSGVWLDQVDLKAYISYSLDNIHQNDLPYYVTQTIYDMLLEPDLEMWRNRSSLSFSDFRPTLTVNFVAVEDSDTTPAELVTSFQKRMKLYESLGIYVKITPKFTTVNVSRRKLPQQLTKNSSSEITFLYSTSLEGFADHVQGVPLFHIESEQPEPPVQGEHYGTEYEQLLRKSQTRSYKPAPFINGAMRFLDSSLNLLQNGSQSPRLKADAAMKHFTLKGIEEVLEKLISAEKFDKTTYQKVCQLVDSILAEESHDWSGHLSSVLALRELV